MNHTQTPWHVVFSSEMGTLITNQDGLVLAKMRDIRQNSGPNANRIMECVNAMDGIEDPEKMRDTWEACKELELDAFHKMEKDRNDLLDVLKTLATIWVKEDTIHSESLIASTVFSLLAKRGELKIDLTQTSTATQIHCVSSAVEREKRKSSMTKVFKEVIDERIRQDAKWGEQNHPCLDPVLLTRENGCTPERMCEEYGVPSEAMAKQGCDLAFKHNYGTFAHIAVEEMSEVISTLDTEKRREELVQLTAVCVAWIEKIDRDLKKESDAKN